MGRFVGWIGPVAYLVAVAAATAVCAWFASFPGVGYWAGWLASALSGAGQLSGSMPWYTTPETASATSLLGTPFIALAVTWCVAVLWLVWQASVFHTGLEDERWTSHILSVAMVSRLVLAPLGIFLTVSAALCLGAGIGSGIATHTGFLTMAVALELLGFALVLPAALYQICAACRLANRGLLGGTALVWNVILAFLPTLGFVAMCGLYVNGRDELIDAHDERVVGEALAELAAKRSQGEEGQERDPVAVDATVEEQAQQAPALPPSTPQEPAGTPEESAEEATAGVRENARGNAEATEGTPETAQGTEDAGSQAPKPPAGYPDPRP